MSRFEEEVRLVELISQAQLMKLRRNSGKPHWREDSLKLLVKRLDGEVQELKAELRLDWRDPGAVLREAADIANYAAMIADNVRAVATAYETS